MTKSAVDLTSMVEKMNDLQERGDKNVRDGNQFISRGQQEQADARKIREAILVILPNYQFDAPPPRNGRGNDASDVTDVDSGEDGEREYGYWTNMVFSIVEELHGTASMKQITVVVRKKPAHATANLDRLKTSVRNALRSLCTTERLEKHKGPSGTVFSIMKPKAQ